MGVNVKWGWGSFIGLLAAVLTPLASFVSSAASQGISDPKTLGYGAVTVVGSALFQWFRTWQANTVVNNGGTAVVIDVPEPDTDIPAEGDPA